MDRDQVRHHLCELQTIFNKKEIVLVNQIGKACYTTEDMNNIKDAISEAINLLSDQARNSDTQEYILKRLNHNESTLLDVKSDIADCNKSIEKVKNTVTYVIVIGIAWLIAKIIATLIWK